VVAFDHRDRPTRPQHSSQRLERADGVIEMLQDEADEHATKRRGIKGQIEEVTVLEGDVPESGAIDPSSSLGERLGPRCPPTSHARRDCCEPA